MTSCSAGAESAANTVRECSGRSPQEVGGVRRGGGGERKLSHSPLMGVPFSLLARGEKEERKKRKEERGGGGKNQPCVGNREKQRCVKGR